MQPDMRVLPLWRVLHSRIHLLKQSCPTGRSVLLLSLKLPTAHAPSLQQALRLGKLGKGLQHGSHCASRMRTLKGAMNRPRVPLLP